MTDDIKITSEEVATGDDSEVLEDFHPGVDDGSTDHTGETIVYEYDEDGNMTGWHKEPK